MDGMMQLDHQKKDIKGQWAGSWSQSKDSIVSPGVGMTSSIENVDHMSWAATGYGCFCSSLPALRRKATDTKSCEAHHFRALNRMLLRGTTWGTATSKNKKP
jgi:hypothetical protein